MVLETYPCQCIHLASATEREPFLQTLRQTLGRDDMKVFQASTGAEWFADPTIPKLHPWEKTPVPQGHIGCTQSHLQILAAAVEAGEPGVLILEDDCEVIDTDGLAAWVPSAPYDWDILLLGANEYVESEEVPTVVGVRRVRRFWGTHAICVRGRALQEVQEAFKEYQTAGQFPPADWLYNLTIRRADLVVYAPSSAKLLVRQRPGLISSITGRPRPT